MTLVRELAPIFATAVGGLVGNALSPDGMGGLIGAYVALAAEAVVAHTPWALNVTMDN